MKNWMKKLASCYEKIRTLYPQDRLIILFDIDGTILDMRQMVLRTVQLFDSRHKTRLLDLLSANNGAVHEDRLKSLMSESEISADTINKFLEWYNNYIWSVESIRESHRPFKGVFEVIRWFQMQPNTFVGLNTGRPEALRSQTLFSLNELGKEYKVHFANDLLYMNRYGWDKNVAECKTEAIIHFRKEGYRIFAMVDDEPENLDAIARIDANREILLLHADTIFASKRKKLPARSVRGNVYDITELIQEKSLPEHIQFVWHCVNDLPSVIQFLNSNIQWAECDLRFDPLRKKVIVSRYRLEDLPADKNESLVYFKDILFALIPNSKSIKLDLRENGLLIDAVIECLKIHDIDPAHLWFNGKVDVLQQDGFRKLKSVYPKAIIQCPIDTFLPQMLAQPDEANRILTNLRSWGINRFSIKWSRDRLMETMDLLDTLGADVNIYGIPDLESFLKTVLLMPKSITSDFNFPKWYYFRRASEEKNNIGVLAPKSSSSKNGIMPIC